MRNFGKISIRNIVGTGFLMAIMIALQTIANYVSIGPVSINLSLIPIAIASIIYGPFAGLLLGLVDGVICIFAPSTMTVFMPVSVLGAIVTCLVKTSVAGFVGGLIYKLIHKKNEIIAIIATSTFLPIINTGLFAVFSLIFFRPILLEYSNNGDIYLALFLVIIGWNFILELGTCSLLSPIVVRLVSYFNKNYQNRFIS